jgi:hypothetical protein
MAKRNSGIIYVDPPKYPPWINPETGLPTRTPEPKAKSQLMPDIDMSLSPVRRARQVFEQLWGEPRKDIIEACVQLGINRSTASTQYQHYKKSREQDQEHRNPATGMPQLAPGERAH